MDENRFRWALGVSEMKMYTLYDKYADFKWRARTANCIWLKANDPGMTNEQLDFFNAGYFVAMDEVRDALGLNAFHKLLQKLQPDES
jgi:hypothetical protein